MGGWVAEWLGGWLAEWLGGWLAEWLSGCRYSAPTTMYLSPPLYYEYDVYMRTVVALRSCGGCCGTALLLQCRDAVLLLG